MLLKVNERKSKCDIKGKSSDINLAGEWIHLSRLIDRDNTDKNAHQQNWPPPIASVASQRRFRSVAPVSSAGSFTAEIMRNGREGGNTFFDSRMFGKHLSQTVCYWVTLREEVERVSPSVEGRRGQFREGRAKRLSRNLPSGVFGANDPWN